MNAKHESSTNRPVVADDVFVSTLIPARHWIASAAALVMTTLTLAVVNLPVRTPEVAWINGIHVTNLAPVEVTPTAAELKAAALLEHAAVGIVTLPDGGRAAQLGAQLAMPYYSFGTTTAGIASSKE
ncbi:hypothetical protein ABQJ54_00105 [Rhodanobacter sp. Si-c]|uniref:Uncharacterized protein n=1 Tax=Rhodanobacter lycopersici TaxID=3162487 RepID=A0ABV3Q8K1_9GAMM